MSTQTSHFITGDPAFAVDSRGVIVFWNAAAEETMGFSSAEALGSKCWKLLAGLDTNGNRYCCRHCPLREMAFRHEPVNGFRSIFKTASRHPRNFAVSCLTVWDSSDNEMLLHICRPESQSAEVANYHASTIDHLGTLSDREAEILKLLANQISTKQIASSLSISIRTVRTHIQHLMYKLQVHKRCEAVEEAKRLKLI